MLNIILLVLPPMGRQAERRSFKPVAAVYQGNRDQLSGPNNSDSEASRLNGYLHHRQPLNAENLCYWV